MTAAAHAHRQLPHPFWADRTDAARRFRADPDATLVLSTDALELLLEESNIDDSVHASHINPLDGGLVFYRFGASQALTGWAAAAPSGPSKAPRRIEGCYCWSERCDASLMSVEQRERFQLVPAPAEMHHLLVVDRLNQSQAVNLFPLDLVIQDPTEDVHHFVSRHVRANPSATKGLGGERTDALLRHLVKLWLYLSGQPESRRVERSRTPRGFTGPSVPFPVTTLIVGPEKLEPLLSAKVMHDNAVSVWRRGRLTVSDVGADGSFVLRWVHPALERRDPNNPY